MADGVAKIRVFEDRKLLMQASDEPLAYGDVALLIDGEWRQAIAGERLPVLNPGTEKQIGWASLARTPDLDAALAAAAHGFSVWKQTAPLQRAKVLATAATLLRAGDGFAAGIPRHQACRRGLSGLAGRQRFVEKLA